MFTSAYLVKYPNDFTCIMGEQQLIDYASQHLQETVVMGNKTDYNAINCVILAASYLRNEGYTITKYEIY